MMSIRSQDSILQTECEYIFKIVLIGDSGVGKSNLLSRFTSQEFNYEQNTTIGVEFATKTITENGIVIKAQIWDTAGQERYKAITNAYYKGAVGALLIYDITKLKSFQNIEKWIRELRENTDISVVTMMIGNKLDLKAQRQVSSAMAAQFSEVHNIAFLEASALDGSNVDLAFFRLINEIYHLLNKKSLVDNTEGVIMGNHNKFMAQSVKLNQQPCKQQQIDEKNCCF